MPLTIVIPISLINIVLLKQASKPLEGAMSFFAFHVVDGIEMQLHFDYKSICHLNVKQ